MTLMPESLSRNVVIAAVAFSLLALVVACEKYNSPTGVPLAESNVLTLSETNFQAEVLSSPQPVLVDFWASWCGPCKIIAPIVSELADEYQGRVKFGKVNVDEESGLARKYEVSAIPTLVLFKDGKPVDQLVGVQSKGALKAALDKLEPATVPGTPASQ